MADRETGRPVQPDSLFRIASLSKPLTSVALLTLIERGKLKLSDKMLDHLAVAPEPEPGHATDPRLRKVTIAQLLWHAGGWDREKSFDPMFRSILIADALGEAPPASAVAIVRYMLGRPLDFDPGERYAYSNFGYCVLGRIIEQVSGAPYESYVQNRVLAPLGISSMRLGRSLRELRAPREVSYYGEEGRTTQAVTGEIGAEVPPPYGGFSLEAMDSHGGWIASAMDLLRFARLFDYPLRDGVLKAATLRTMLVRPPGRLGVAADGSPTPTYYALGWNVRPLSDGKANVWHIGALDGSSTLLVHRFDNLSWAVLFNKRRPDREGSQEFADMIDGPLHHAAAAVTKWPEDDLFGRYR